MSEHDVKRARIRHRPATLLLAVGLAAVGNAENQEALIRSDVDDPIVADPQAPESLKLTPKRLPSLSPRAEFLLNPFKDSRGFSSYASYVK